MPHITTAMEGSLRRVLADVPMRSLHARTISGEVSSVQNTFSSWDNCMQQSYCKWPAIAVIVLVALIVFSIITCIVRCACCGYSCCCACFRFLECLDCCGGCCDGKKNKPMKHLDEPYSQSSGPQGYRAPVPMISGGLGGKEPPLYAQFEVGKGRLAADPKLALNEDALPPMPSWDTASKKHIADEEKNAVELGDLNPATGQNIPLMAGAASTGMSSPVLASERNLNPFDARPAPTSKPSYRSAPDPYGPSPAFAVPGRSYTASPNLDHSYRGAGQGRYVADGPAGNGYPQERMGSPAPGSRSFPVRNGPSPAPGPRGYAQDRMGPAGGYGTRDPYAPPDQYADKVAIDVRNEYGRPPQRQYSDTRQMLPQTSRSYINDSRPMNPGRQYTDPTGYERNGTPSPRGPPRGTGGLSRTNSPAAQANNSEFDFGPGFYSNSAPRTPQPQPQGQAAYPGYRAYRPAPSNGNG